MCIIAALPVGHVMSDETLENCWNNNPDGGGFTYVNEHGVVEIFKSKHLKVFQRAYKAHAEKYADISPFILHFRIATHGSKSIENVHPFKVNKNLAFAHNGVISIHIPDDLKKADFSDTRTFNELVLKKLPADFYYRGPYKFLIEGTIGFSKLAFLDKDREVYIMNAEKGVWDGEVWYSNSTFRTSRPVKCSTATTGTSTSYGYGGGCGGTYSGYQSPYSSTPSPAPAPAPPASTPVEPSVFTSVKTDTMRHIPEDATVLPNGIIEWTDGRGLKGSYNPDTKLTTYYTQVIKPEQGEVIQVDPPKPMALVPTTGYMPDLVEDDTTYDSPEQEVSFLRCDWCQQDSYAEEVQFVPEMEANICVFCMPQSMSLAHWLTTNAV